MKKSNVLKENKLEDKLNYLIIKERRERYINYILVILIIIFLIFSIIYINSNKNIYNEEIAYTDTSTSDNKKEDGFIRFVYDGFNHNNPPSKKDYEIKSVSCNNAKGNWNNKSWQLNISNIVDKISCSLTFKKKIKVIATNKTKQQLKKNKSNKPLIKSNNKELLIKNVSDNNDKLLTQLPIDNKTDNLNTKNSNNTDKSDYKEEQKELIKSNKYIINHDNKTINNIELKTNINDFISNIVNIKDYLHIYDLNNNEINDYTTYIGTGMKIKLENDNKIYDELEVVVLGDIDGNGKCMSSDYRLVNKHILGQIELIGSKYFAADVNKDNIINNNDYELINKYIMKQIDSFIKE